MFRVKFAEKEMEFDAPLSVYEASVAAELSSRAVLCAKVNGRVVAMTEQLFPYSVISITRMASGFTSFASMNSYPRKPIC